MLLTSFLAQFCHSLRPWNLNPRVLMDSLCPLLAKPRSRLSVEGKRILRDSPFKAAWVRLPTWWSDGPQHHNEFTITGGQGLGWGYAGFYLPGIENWPRTLFPDAYKKRSNNIARLIKRFFAHVLRFSALLRWLRLLVVISCEPSVLLLDRNT
jgi:hypothetical protein